MYSLNLVSADSRVHFYQFIPFAVSVSIFLLYFISQFYP